MRMAWLDRQYALYPALSEAIAKLYALPYELNLLKQDCSSCCCTYLEPAARVALYEYRTMATQPSRLDNRRDAPLPAAVGAHGGDRCKDGAAAVEEAAVAAPVVTIGHKDSGIRLTASYHLVPATAVAAGKELKQKVHVQVQVQSAPPTHTAGAFVYSYCGAGAGASAGAGAGAGTGAGAGGGWDGNDSDAGSRGSLSICNDSLVLHESTEVRNGRPPATGHYYVLCFFLHGRDD